MADRKDGDRVRTAGTVLIGVGVGMWVIYAVGRYVLGWNITDRDFLPYHLITILPGMVLRYHRFFFEELPAGFLRGESKPRDLDRSTEARRTFFKALIIVNNFVHDLFTGLWASSLLVIYFLDKRARAPQGLLISPALHDVMRMLFWLGVISMAVIVASGGLRLLYYRTETAGEDEKIKKDLLIIKHVLFTFVFIGGTYFSYLHAFS